MVALILQFLFVYVYIKYHRYVCQMNSGIQGPWNNFHRESGSDRRSGLKTFHVIFKYSYVFKPQEQNVLFTSSTKYSQNAYYSILSQLVYIYNVGFCTCKNVNVLSSYLLGHFVCMMWLIYFVLVGWGTFCVTEQYGARIIGEGEGGHILMNY